MRNSGLEPECFKQTLESESSASTNSASSAAKLSLQTIIMIDFYLQCQTSRTVGVNFFDKTVQLNF